MADNLVTEITFREAAPRDIEAIAAIQADNWRRHYRGAYRDAFLDGPVVADRRAEWSQRLAAPDEDRLTVVAEHGGEVAGVVHMILDADPHWGALLDDLHVTHHLTRRGIGRMLLVEAASWLVQRRSADSRFYLWVLDQNTAAQAFYAACGGTAVEKALSDSLLGGGRARFHRMAWPDATKVVELSTRNRLDSHQPEIDT